MYPAEFFDPVPNRDHAIKETLPAVGANMVAPPEIAPAVFLRQRLCRVFEDVLLTKTYRDREDTRNRPTSECGTTHAWL